MSFPLTERIIAMLRKHVSGTKKQTDESGKNLAPLIVEAGRKQGMHFRLSDDGKVALLICPVDGKTIIAKYAFTVADRGHT